MLETQSSRRLDSIGRLVIPSKLREQLSLESGDDCEFYIHEEKGVTYLCIKCPKALSELDKAKQLLEAHGYKIN